MIDEYLTRCAVLGAGGKMGSGISLLILQEMARNEAEKNGSFSSDSVLYLIDKNESSHVPLKQYLKGQLKKYAEKNIITLRNYFKDRKDLVENSEIIEAFTDGALSMVRLDSETKRAAGAKLVFEAILERIDVKSQVYSELGALSSKDTYFLTNTSSIPISLIDKKANLNGRIIGFHFYNPPPVQRLVEIIAPEGTAEGLVTLSKELGKRLNKTLVPSNDIAGFIGNGHFMRDILFGDALVTELSKDRSLYQAIDLVNTVSQDYMVRPMGIFQLADYVGLDICRLIMTIMTEYGKDTLKSPLIDSMLDAGIAGGQYPDGSQKNGFFLYEKGKPAGIYSLLEKRYILYSEGSWKTENESFLGGLPAGHESWKSLMKDRNSKEKLKVYFTNLFASSTKGSDIARRYLLESRSIAEDLVKNGIANAMEDVNIVLKNGFFHIYGPQNELF